VCYGPAPNRFAHARKESAPYSEERRPRNLGEIADVRLASVESSGAALGQNIGTTFARQSLRGLKTPAGDPGVVSA